MHCLFVGFYIDHEKMKPLSPSVIEMVSATTLKSPVEDISKSAEEATTGYDR